MAFSRPFLVGAGCIPDQQMRSISKALAKAWGGNLIEFSCLEDPNKALDSLQDDQGLVQLVGDAAVQNSTRGSWLEALGAWRQPMILLVVPLLSGELPGVAHAYTALCNALCVPLLGIVQVGGDWNSFQRKSDGLPWCGWIPEEGQSQKVGDKSFIRYEVLKAEETALILRQRLKELSL